MGTLQQTRRGSLKQVRRSNKLWTRLLNGTMNISIRAASLVKR